MSGRENASGSRFLYEPFECSKPACEQSLRLEAYERVMAERWVALEYRLKTMEALMQRLERRMWMTIVGVAGVVLSEAAASLLILP